MSEDRGDAKWVTDTSVFTHLSRAGHLSILERLAPEGVLLVPSQVNVEIDAGREKYSDISSTASLNWVELVVLSDDEILTFYDVKSKLGGAPGQHLGESEVITVAQHRGGVALLDERAAKAQAEHRGVSTVDTLRIVIEAHKNLFACDRMQTIAVVDALIKTGMFLPIRTGSEIIFHAYREGWLPE